MPFRRAFQPPDATNRVTLLCDKQLSSRLRDKYQSITTMEVHVAYYTNIATNKS